MVPSRLEDSDEVEGVGPVRSRESASLWRAVSLSGSRQRIVCLCRMSWKSYLACLERCVRPGEVASATCSGMYSSNNSLKATSLAASVGLEPDGYKTITAPSTATTGSLEIRVTSSGS